MPSVDDLLRALEGAIEIIGGEVLSVSSAAQADRAAVDQASLRAPSLEALTEALAHVPNDGGYDEWIPGLCAIRAAAAGLADDDGRELARDWTNRWTGGGSGTHIDFDAKWNQQKPPFRVGWPWVEIRARAGGWTGGALTDFAGVEAPVLVPGNPSPLVASVATAPGATNRFPLRSMEDCITSVARPYLIKGVLGRGDLAILFGPPGAGKSALAPYIALAAAQGRSVFGKRVRQCRVLYVAAEDGHGMRGRVRALWEAHGPSTNLLLIDIPPNLGGASDLADVQARIAECGADLVIVDTMAAAFPGLRENESEDMGRAVAALRSLSAPTGAAVLVLHHGTKNNDRGPRGHSLLNGAVDLTLEVTAPAPGERVRTVTFGKNRNGPSDGVTWYFDVQGATIGIDEDGEPETAALASEVPAGAARPKAKLTKIEKAALGALHASIETDGAPLPVGDGYPETSTEGVCVDAWRKECDRRGISAAEDAKDRYRAFKRAREALVEKGLVAVRDDKAWAVRAVQGAGEVARELRGDQGAPPRSHHGVDAAAAHFHP
nr:AAA family ATPase [Siccirubricoccus soli]